MASKFSFVILTVFVMFALAAADDESEERWGSMGSLGSFGGQACGNNEVRMFCGSRCPVTCANLAAPPSCKGCTKGCFCRPGFFRNTAGACVLRANC